MSTWPLGDLYGAIGSPVRLTRTVVLGKQKDLVQRILYVLTYFVLKDTTKAATKGHQKRKLGTDHMGKEDIFTRYWTQCLLPFPWS